MEEHLTKTKDYGFREENVVIEKEAYTTLGARLPFTVHNETGQWDTPIYEAQATGFETSGCTAYGTLNQVETFIKRVFGFEPNYDDRFTYILADIKHEQGGGNPQDVYQSIRHDGLYSPNSARPATLEEFRDKSYITAEKRHVGREWLSEYQLKHEWVDNCNSREVIKQMLRYSPIAISVSAWFKEGDLYVDLGQQNNHWCLCYGYIEDERGIILKVFDTYDHSHKLLHPDHRIAFAKRISIEKALPKRSIWAMIKTFFWEIWR